MISDISKSRPEYKTTSLFQNNFQGNKPCLKFGSKRYVHIKNIKTCMSFCYDIRNPIPRRLSEKSERGSLFPVPSDYQYLSEHFRESHYLCEEGRCATEQFTHAFRSEIDYKAHKASAHSKNRAEARQNRQIDLQFTYAPRLQRRNDGEHGAGAGCLGVGFFGR